MMIIRRLAAFVSGVLFLIPLGALAQGPIFWSKIAIGAISVIAPLGCGSAPQPVSKIVSATAGDSKESKSPVEVSSADHCMKLVTAVSNLGRSTASVLASQRAVLVAGQVGSSENGIDKARELSANCAKTGNSAKEVIALAAGFSPNPAAGEIREWADSVLTVMDQMQKAVDAAVGADKLGTLRAFWVSPKGRRVSMTLAAAQQTASEDSLRCITGHWQWTATSLSQEQPAH